MKKDYIFVDRNTDPQGDLIDWGDIEDEKEGWLERLQDTLTFDIRDNLVDEAYNHNLWLCWNGDLYIVKRKTSNDTWRDIIEDEKRVLWHWPIRIETVVDTIVNGIETNDIKE